MKYEKLSKDILKYIGGEKNIMSLTHCVTRLRFKLKDDKKANKNELEKLDDIVTVVVSGGQFQVVIGNNVSEVYEDFLKVANLSNESNGDLEDEDKGIINKFVDVVSSIFAPCLGVLAATGMLKGFTGLFMILGFLSAESGTYKILNAIGDSFFYYFPIFLGYTASKKFKLNNLVGMVLGASLLHPSLYGPKKEILYTLFKGSFIQSDIYMTFFNIPVILIDYSSSVIPIIISCYFAAKVEKILKNIIPSVVKSFLLPLFTVLIIGPLMFILIGPLTTWGSDLLGIFTTSLYDLSPTIAGVFIGGFWQVFVIFGLHWGIIPIYFNNISTLGKDPILAPYFAASFAQMGIVLAILFKTKDKKLKTLCVPAFISSIFGVTEPAIYGITLPKKKPFILSCIIAGICGGIIGFSKTNAYIIGGLGIFEIPSFINPKTGLDFSFYGMIISIIVAFILGFVIMYLIYKDDYSQDSNTNLIDNNIDNNIQNKKIIDKIIIKSPLKGELIELNKVNDEAFSKELLGKGIGIIPKEGKVYSPVDGVVTTLFPTNHAIGITGDNKEEILIHIGINTVELDGKYFHPRVKQGQNIKQGDLLIDFDKDEILKCGYEIQTPIIITNTNNFLDIIPTTKKYINENQDLINIIK